MKINNIFKKKKHDCKKSIDDLKKLYDSNGEFRYAVVLLSNGATLWACKDYEDAMERVADERRYNFRQCEVVDLAYL